MKRITIVVVICTVLAKVSGFVRVFALSAFFGNGPIAEAFNYSNNIPNQWFSIIASSFVVGLIPMYLMIEQNENHKKADSFFNNIMNIVLLFSAVLSGVFLIFPEAILGVITGYDGYTLELTIQFTRIAVSAVFTVSVVQLFTGYLNIKESFIVPALISVPANIIVVIAIVAAQKGNVDILVWGNWLSMIVQAVVIVLYAKQKGYHYQWSLDFKDPYLRKMVVNSLPVIITSVSSQICNILINVYITRENGVTLMTNSNLIIGFVQAVFATTITSLYYPKLARYVVKENHKSTEEIINKSMIMIGLFIIPSTFGLFILSFQISLYFFSNKLAYDQTILLSDLLRLQALALLANCLIDVFTRLYYAYQKMRIPMYFSLANIILSVLLGIILYSMGFGLRGITLGSSIISCLVFVLYFIYTHYKLGLKNQKRVVISFVKIIVSSIIMSIAVLFVSNYLNGYIAGVKLLFISIAIGVLVYGVCVILANIQEVNTLMDWMRAKIKGFETR